jgi:hypothetical protein
VQEYAELYRDLLERDARARFTDGR